MDYGGREGAAAQPRVRNRVGVAARPVAQAISGAPIEVCASDTPSGMGEDHDDAEVRPVPTDLQDLIHLNAAHGVLICVGCREAVRPRSFVEHLKRKHGGSVGWERRKRVGRYVQEFGHDYEHSTVALPAAGTAPQAMLPITRGFECTKCQFRSSNDTRMRAHGNSAHGLKWVRFDAYYQAVQMQTWFRSGRQRYWVVSEGDETAEGQPEGRRGRADAARRQRKARRRRVTGVGVEAMAQEEEGRGPVRRESALMDGGAAGGPVEGDGAAGGGKRVRFAGQVEIGGVEGLRGQLERWVRGCIVCYLVDGGGGHGHTMWECEHPAAEGIRMDSRHMADGMRAGGDGGSCRGCSVPRALCGRWQWGSRWEESVGGCQYAGVLISTMMAMAGLGAAEGRRQVGEWLRRDGVDPRGREEAVFAWFRRGIWWEGIEAGQVVLVFMMLARINGALRVPW